MNEEYLAKSRKPRGRITFTSDPEDMAQCEAMLVYLNDDTWTSGVESERLGVQVAVHGGGGSACAASPCDPARGRFLQSG